MHLHLAFPLFCPTATTIVRLNDQTLASPLSDTFHSRLQTVPNHPKSTAVFITLHAMKPQWHPVVYTSGLLFLPIHSLSFFYCQEDLLLIPNTCPSLYHCAFVVIFPVGLFLFSHAYSNPGVPPVF